MEKEIVLGLDPGTKITGFGIVEKKGSTLTVIDYGLIKLPQRIESSEKYYTLYSSIKQLLLKHGPSSVAVESQFMYKNAQTALKLGIAKGAALIACGELRIPITEYAPSKAKIAVAGKGSASKEQIQKMIQILLKLPSLPLPFDATDALAIAYCHLQNKRWLQTLRSSC